jgi:hypothetical protein
MCISNIGNRRPYPTNGFKIRGAVDTPTSVASSSDGPGDTHLMNTVVLKDDQRLRKTSSPTTVVEGDKTCKNSHIVVQHDYHDHSNDRRVDYQEDHPARGGVTTPFPLKLHEMLDTVRADGMEHIVSWQPHGRCFVVHKTKEFVELLPHYFKLSKLASFQRQLNLYGFQRLTRGPDKGGYYHELFLQDKVFLAHSIQRIKVKGTGVRARSNPDQEPDFWSMPWLGSSSCSNFTSTAIGVSVASVESTRFQQQQEDLFSMKLPLELEPTALHPSFPLKEEVTDQYNSEDNIDDLLSVFGDKKFRFLDPFQPQSSQQVPVKELTIGGVDELLTSEAESFFEGFDFPSDIGDEIEDDGVFGDYLEQMIA